MDKCTPEKLEEFSKKHFTYINQIFGDATIREIIQDEYPTTYEFAREETGAEFEFSFHHTVKDKENDEIICSVADGYQNIYKNKNDTLCQSYSLMNYFDIDMPDDKRDRQLAMIQMYRDLLNKTLPGFEGIDFKEIINTEILRVRANKTLWENFVTNNGYISMAKKTFFKNIENTLDEWEEYGYWYFIGKGNCPKHETYSSEMRSQGILSREMSRERDENYYMGVEDIKHNPLAVSPLAVSPLAVSPLAVSPLKLSTSKSSTKKSNTSSKSSNKSITKRKGRSRSRSKSKSKSRSRSKSKSRSRSRSK